MSAAGQNPEAALSYQLLAAFGVTLGALMTIAEKMLSSSDASAIIMALTAGVQIRNHVVFVGREYANVRQAYPDLIIEGDRDQRDIFNFGALHALGHVMAHVTGQDLGRKILSKAGSCITGENLTTSEAGNINREIFNGWSVEDKSAWAAWLVRVKTARMAWLDTVVTSIPERARTFTVLMRPASAPTAPPTAPVRPTQAGKAAPASES